MRSEPSQVSRLLKYPGSKILVEGPPGDVGWLVQFLGPWFSSRIAPEIDCEVRILRDQVAFEKALGFGADPRGRRRPAYYLDTRTESLPLWAGPGDTITVFDRHHQALVTVSPGGRRIVILCPEEGRLPRLAMMKVVREHALSRLMGQKGLLLHASAVVLGGLAALVIGVKRSGKTSLMLHALSRHDSHGPLENGPARFMANDRVWAFSGGKRPAARGFPTISSLRLPSLELFPGIADRLAESSWMPAATLRESRLRSAPPSAPWDGRKYTLSPKQLCRLLGVRAAARADIGALLFPRITGEAGRVRMAPIARDEAKAALLKGLFRAGLRQKAGGVFAAPGFPRRISESEEARRVESLLDAVPSYSVDLGLDAYSDWRWVERLGAAMRRESSS